MMNKEKIISLSLVGAIGLGSCMPAMAAKTDGEPDAKKVCLGSSLGSSQSGAINNMEDVYEDTKRKIEEVLENITTTIHGNILAEGEIIKEEAEKQHKKVDEAVKKAVIERNEIYRVGEKRLEELEEEIGNPAKLEEITEEYLVTIEKKATEHIAKLEKEIGDREKLEEIKKVLSKFITELEVTKENLEEIKEAVEENGNSAELEEIRKIILESFITLEEKTNEDLKNLYKEIIEIKLKEADENLKQIQKEAKEQREVIEQATAAKLKEFDGGIDKQLDIFYEKILGIIEQKPDMVETVYDTLTSLGELIKKFGTFQKIETTKSEVTGIYKEIEKKHDEINNIVKACEAEDHVLNYYADKIYIGEIYTNTNNNEILKNEREKFAGIEKIHKEYDKIYSETSKIYDQLSWHTYNRILDEFCQKIVEFSNKLKSSPEMLNLLEEIFGKDFKYIAQKCNKLEEAYVACNKAKEESETYLKLRNKAERGSKEYVEMHKKLIIKNREHDKNKSEIEKLREDIIGKLEIFIKSKHISGLGGIEECCRDIDKKYKEAIGLAKVLEETKSEFEIAKGEFKIAKDAFNEVAKKANEKSKEEVKKAEEILANHQQLITLATEGRVADKYVVLARDEIRKIYETRRAELVKSERWLGTLNEMYETWKRAHYSLEDEYDLILKEGTISKEIRVRLDLERSEVSLTMLRALVKEANEILANQRKELSILEKALKAAEEVKKAEEM